MLQKILILTVGICVLGTAGITHGQNYTIGVVGDSLTDEYQFADDGNHSAGRNWLEQLATCQGVDFGTFSSNPWPYPRTEGYEYNWARVGATTDNVIYNQGQHTGLLCGDQELHPCNRRHCRISRCKDREGTQAPGRTPEAGTERTPVCHFFSRAENGCQGVQAGRRH